MKCICSTVAVLFSLVLPACRPNAVPQTYLPPAGSALALKQHPRVFVTAADLQPLRQRFSGALRNEFQRFVQELDAHFNEKPEAKEKGFPYLDTNNYAFLFLIDPATLPTIQFGHSREQYGRKALEHAWLLKDETRGDKHSSANLQGSSGGYHSLALAVAYDWLHPMLSDDEKRALADGMIRLYDSRDKDAMPGKYSKLSNQVTGYIHAGCAAALALWGEPLGVEYERKTDEMLDYLNAVLLERSLEVGDKVFEGPGWSEGASYYMLGMTNLSFLTAAASSALGKNLFYEHDFLRYNVLYIFYNILPLKLRDDYYMSRHDTNSLQDVVDHEISRLLAIAAGALRRDDPRMAGLARWMMTDGGYGLRVEQYRYFDPRIDYLFFRFLWDSEEVTPLSPEMAQLPLTYRLGLGQNVMKSSFDSETSTHIIFWTPKFWYSPHAHLDIASFTIFKHGSLALDAGNGKNADDMPRCSSFREPVFHNILGLYQKDEEEEFNFFSYGFSPNSSDDSWKDEAYQPGGRNHIGDVQAFESTANYDYIDYDYSRSHTADKRPLTKSAQRRFVYLRGPENREFVLIHDLVDSQLEKRWLLHTAFEPEIASNQITVTNNFDRAHGRMFVKSLLPEKTQILKVGGSGKWFVDADWKPIKSRGPYVDWGAYWTGSFRAEIRAMENEFLTVMQIGDSRTLNEMASVEKIVTPTHVGAFIDHSRLVLLNRSASPTDQLAFSITANQEASFVIGGLPKDGWLKIYKNGAFLINVKSSTQGILNFRDTLAGASRYEISPR